MIRDFGIDLRPPEANINKLYSSQNRQIFPDFTSLYTDIQQGKTGANKQRDRIR